MSVPIQVGDVVQIGGYLKRVSALLPDGRVEVFTTVGFVRYEQDQIQRHWAPATSRAPDLDALFNGLTQILEQLYMATEFADEERAGITRLHINEALTQAHNLLDRYDT